MKTVKTICATITITLMIFCFLVLYGEPAEDCSLATFWTLKVSAAAIMYASYRATKLILED